MLSVSGWGILGYCRVCNRKFQWCPFWRCLRTRYRRGLCRSEWYRFPWLCRKAAATLAASSGVTDCACKESSDSVSAKVQRMNLFMMGWKFLFLFIFRQLPEVCESLQAKFEKLMRQSYQKIGYATPSAAIKMWQYFTRLSGLNTIHRCNGTPFLKWDNRGNHLVKNRCIFSGDGLKFCCEGIKIESFL